MARPSKVEQLKPVAVKFKKFDESLNKIRESLSRDPARLVDTGIAIGEAQALYIDLNQILNHYGFIDSGDAKMSQIENSLNDIEKCLKENVVNVPLIGFNIGVASVSSNILKEAIGLNVQTKATKAT